MRPSADRGIGPPVLSRAPFLETVLLLGLVALSLGRVVGHDFLATWDDTVYVTANPSVRRGLSWETALWAVRATELGFWHPVTWLSHMLDISLFGLRPWGHHLTSLLLHGAAAVVLYRVLHRMTGAAWRSWLVAALFAVHPLHVESVAWVSERKDVLCALFWFLALGAYLRYAKRPGLGSYLVLLAVFALGLASKPMIVTLPFVLLLLDLWPLKRWRGFGGDPGAWPGNLRVLAEKVPLLIMVMPVSYLSLVAQRQWAGPESFDPLPLGERVSYAATATVSYLGRLFVPANLAPLYPRSDGGTSLASAGAAALALVVLSCVVWHWRKGKPYLLVGWLWYLGTLVPVSGLVQVGRVGMADRYLYVPAVGIFLALVWGIGEWLARQGWRAVVAPGLGAVVVLGCGVLAWSQAGIWRDDVALWSRAVEVTDGNWLAHNNLGSAYHLRGERERAAREFREAIRIAPGRVLPHYNLGVVLDELGDQAGAEAALGEAALLRRGTFPRDAKVSQGDENLSYDDLNRRGIGFAMEGRTAEAETMFRQAIALQPDAAGAYHNLGKLLSEAGRTDEGLAALDHALALAPDFAEAHLARGVVFHTRGDWRRAEESYRRALELNPASAAARTNLAAVLQRQRAMNAFPGESR